MPAIALGVVMLLSPFLVRAFSWLNRAGKIILGTQPPRPALGR